MRLKLIRALSAALMAVSVAGANIANADPVKPEAPRYVVLEQNARIPFGHLVNSWSVADDHSILLRVGVNQWYRGTTDRACARELRFHTRVALVDRFNGGAIDRGSHFRVGHLVCYFDSLDRIENPHQTVASR